MMPIWRQGGAAANGVFSVSLPGGCCFKYRFFFSFLFGSNRLQPYSWRNQLCTADCKLWHRDGWEHIIEPSTDLWLPSLEIVLLWKRMENPLCICLSTKFCQIPYHCGLKRDHLGSDVVPPGLLSNAEKDQQGQIAFPQPIQTRCRLDNCVHTHTKAPLPTIASHSSQREKQIRTCIVLYLQISFLHWDEWEDPHAQEFHVLMGAANTVLVIFKWWRPEDTSSLWAIACNITEMGKREGCPITYHCSVWNSAYTWVWLSYNRTLTWVRNFHCSLDCLGWEIL